VERDVKSDRIIAAAERISQQADTEGASVKALGGVGCWLHLTRHGDDAAPYRRDYGDLDIVVRRGGQSRITGILTALGYTPMASFNAVHGETRMMFVDPELGSRIDVFLGEFQMCHEVPLPGEAFPSGHAALAMPELVLMKLQVVEANEKDLRDVAGLFAFHDADELDDGRLVKALSRDWGLWRTVTENLGRLAALQTGDAAHDARVHATAAELNARAESSSKSMRWKARAVVGERSPWYETPEEPEVEAVAVR
jgi:hypothetical protein